MLAELKQHDTARPLTDNLLLNGVQIDLTGATIVFVMRLRDPEGNGAISRITNVDIVTGDPGTNVKIDPTDEMVALAGTFDCEWEVTFPTDTVITVPTRGYEILRINPDIE